MSENKFLDLIIKTADQQCPDWSVRCDLSWSVSRLKQYLCELYPDELKKNDQKLIYGGKVLADETLLNTLFNANSSQNYSNVIHLVRKHYKLPNSAAPPPPLTNEKKVHSASSSAYCASSCQQPAAGRTCGVSAAATTTTFTPDATDGLPPQLFFQLPPRPELTSAAARQQYVQALHQMHGAYFQYVQNYQNLYYTQNMIQPLRTTASVTPFTSSFGNSERLRFRHTRPVQPPNGNDHRHYHHYHEQQEQLHLQPQPQPQPQQHHFPRAFEIINFINFHSTITFIVQLALVVLLLFKYRTLWRLVVFAGCVLFALFLRYIRRPLHQLQPHHQQQQQVAPVENGETNDQSRDRDNNETSENNEDAGTVNAHDAGGLVPVNENVSFYSAVFKGIVIVTRAFFQSLLPDPIEDVA